MTTVAATPPHSLKTIAEAAAEAFKHGNVFEFELYMLHEVWDGAVEGLDFLKAVVMGEFADHRPVAVLITEALASFVPGVAIVQSVRDATAISLRLIYHPEKRSDWMEWVMLAVNLTVVCLPVVLAAVQAAIGVAAAGVGAAVGAAAGLIEGSELGALIRLVFLMMAKGGMKLAEVVAMMGKTTKGNVLNLLKKLQLDKLKQPLCDAVKAMVSKFTEALRYAGEQLGKLLEYILQMSTTGWVVKHFTLAREAVEEGVRPLRELIAKMADLEKRFYAFQTDAMTALPNAIAQIQARLTALFAEQVAADTHLVAAGVKAGRPAAVAITPQKVHPRVDHPLTKLEEQMPPKAKLKAAARKTGEPADTTKAGPNALDEPQVNSSSKDVAPAESPTPEKAKVPDAPQDAHPNVKRRLGDDAGGSGGSAKEPKRLGDGNDGGRGDNGGGSGGGDGRGKKPPRYKTTPMKDEYKREEIPDNKDAWHEGWGTVKYLNESEREAFRITFRDGKAYDASGNLFDTSAGPNGRAIFVMDDEGRFFASNRPQYAEFHHSSFLAGQPVASAGELEVQNGIVTALGDRSGHYQPSAEFMEQGWDSLAKENVPMKYVMRDWRP